MIVALPPQLIVVQDVVKFFTLIGFIFLGFCAGIYAMFKPMCMVDGSCIYDYSGGSETAWSPHWVGSGFQALAGSVRFLMFMMIGQGDAANMEQKPYAGALLSTAPLLRLPRLHVGARAGSGAGTGHGSAAQHHGS